MKRLVVVSSSYFPTSGGQEFGLDGFLHAVRQCTGCEVCIVTPQFDRRAPREEIRSGFKVFRYPTTTIPYPRGIFPSRINLSVHMAHGLVAIPGLLDRLEPDRILAYFLAPTAFPTVRHARAMGVGCAVFLGGSDVFQVDWPIAAASRYALENADRVIATSRFVRDCARMNFGALQTPFVIVPYGIDLRSVPAPRRRPRGHRRILCVQRLVPSKGTHVLLKAFHRLVQGGRPDVHLDIVGDGPERRPLESLASGLGLLGCVTFHGEQPRERVLSHFFPAADIFCFPTYSEGFGIVLLEAMAAGCLIVASRSTSIPEIVREDETGLLFEPGDYNDLASILESVLAEPDRYAPMAGAASEAVRNYDLAEVGGRLANVLEAMPGPKVAGAGPLRGGR